MDTEEGSISLRSIAGYTEQEITTGMSSALQALKALKRGAWEVATAKGLISTPCPPVGFAQCKLLGIDPAKQVSVPSEEVFEQLVMEAVERLSEHQSAGPEDADLRKAFALDHLKTLAKRDVKVVFDIRQIDKLAAFFSRVYPHVHTAIKHGQLFGPDPAAWHRLSFDQQQMVLALEDQGVHMARWFLDGKPTLQIASHTYVSALACTDPGEHEYHLPWHTFMLELPDGLFASDFAGVMQPIKYVLVCTMPEMPDGSHQLQFHAYTLGGGDLRWTQNGLVDQVADWDSEYDLNSTDRRTQDAITRIAINACIEIANSYDGRPERLGKPAIKILGEYKADGKVTKYKVGRPVQIDCRPALAQWLSGKRGGPRLVKWLRRGHWTHVVCGKGRVGRRLKWIEPHWVNKHAETLLVRPHVLGPKEL